MAKQRMISTRFWSDPWVVDELNPLDRYLFLYLLTNEKTNITGAYELSLRTMSNETGIEREELSRMLKRLESRVIYVMGWVVFRKAIKHQNFNSPKIEAAVARELKDIPKEVLQYIELPNNFGELLHSVYGIDTVSIPYASGIAPNLTKLNLTKPIPNLTNTNTKPIPDPALAEPKQQVEKVPTELITEMLNYWGKTVQLELGNENAQRKAIAALVRQRGKEQLKRLVDGVALALEDQYAPRISDFVSLKRKQNDLLVWGRKRNWNNNVEVI